MIVWPADSEFFAETDPIHTGLTGDLTVMIKRGDTIITPATTAGIVEFPALSGIYTATLTSPAVAGLYSIVWNYLDPDTDEERWGNEDLIVTTSVRSDGIAVSGPPLATGSKISIVQSDDYHDDEARSWVFTDSEEVWPDLTDAEIEIAFTGPLTGAVHAYPGTVVASIPPVKQVQVELTAEDTGDLDIGTGRYDVHALLSSGRKVTLLRGRAKVLENP